MGYHIKLGTHRYLYGNRPPSWISKWLPRKTFVYISLSKAHRKLILVSKSTKSRSRNPILASN